MADSFPEELQKEVQAAIEDGRFNDHLAETTERKHHSHQRPHAPKSHRQTIKEWADSMPNKPHGWQKDTAGKLKCTPGHFRNMLAGTRDPDARTSWMTARKLTLIDSIDPEYGLTADEVASWISANYLLDEIDMCVNSPGGSIFECMTANTILSQSGKIRECEVGAVVTAGSYLTCIPAKEIVFGTETLLVLQKCHATSQGGAEDFIQTADLLKKCDLRVAELISESLRNGKTITAERVLEMMQADTWLNAEECLEMGFCDRIEE